MISEILESLSLNQSVLLLNEHSYSLVILVKSKLVATCKYSSLSEYYRRSNITLSTYIKDCFESAAYRKQVLIIESVDELIQTSDSTTKVEFVRLLSLYRIPILCYSSSNTSHSFYYDYFDKAFLVPSQIDSQDAQLLGCSSSLSYSSYLYDPSRSQPDIKVSRQFRQIPWSKVGGLKGVKDLVWKIAAASLWTDSKSKSVRPATGILLAGPPGTGKTLIARALATESSCAFIASSIGELLHSHVGESELAISRLFSDARASQPSIIFLDEIEALFSSHGVSGIGKKLTAQLVYEFDELARSGDRILVIGATNHLGIIEKRLLRLGRFEVTIAISLPDQAERVDILKSLDVPTELLEKIAERTHGKSGAELAQIVQLAKQNSFSRNSESIDFVDLKLITES